MLRCFGGHTATHPAAGTPTAMPRARSIREKWLAGGFSLALIGAVLWPVVQNWRRRPRDNFPLSYYPMFSAKRSQRVRVTYLVGHDAHGQRRIISYKLAGPGGMNQVRRQIRRIVRQGRADQLCRAVAGRIAHAQAGPWADLVTVQVVTGTYRLDDYFSGKQSPLSEVVHAEHAVKGAAPCVD